MTGGTPALIVRPPCGIVVATTTPGYLPCPDCQAFRALFEREGENPWIAQCGLAPPFLDSVSRPEYSEAEKAEIMRQFEEMDCEEVLEEFGLTDLVDPPSPVLVEQRTSADPLPANPPRSGTPEGREFQCPCEFRPAIVFNEAAEIPDEVFAEIGAMLEGRDSPLDDQPEDLAIRGLLPATGDHDRPSIDVEDEEPLAPQEDGLEQTPGDHRTVRIDDLKESARFFRALADPHRLAILIVIEGGRLTVRDIKTRIGEPNDSKLSYHLSVLDGIDLISGDRRGNWIFYRLAERGQLALSVYNELGGGPLCP